MSEPIEEDISFSDESTEDLQEGGLVRDIFVRPRPTTEPSTRKTVGVMMSKPVPSNRLSKAIAKEESRTRRQPPRSLTREKRKTTRRSPAREKQRTTRRSPAREKQRTTRRVSPSMRKTDSSKKTYGRDEDLQKRPRQTESKLSPNLRKKLSERREGRTQRTTRERSPKQQTKRSPTLRTVEEDKPQQRRMRKLGKPTSEEKEEPQTRRQRKEPQTRRQRKEPQTRRQRKVRRTKEQTGQRVIRRYDRFVPERSIPPQKKAKIIVKEDARLKPLTEILEDILEKDASEQSEFEEVYASYIFEFEDADDLITMTKIEVLIFMMMYYDTQDLYDDHDYRIELMKRTSLSMTRGIRYRDHEEIDKVKARYRK